MHIMDQIAEALVNDGWTRAAGMYVFTKTVETGGAFGSTTVTLRMPNTGRWLERVDGWNHVERDVDLRNFSNDPIGAIAEVTPFGPRP